MKEDITIGRLIRILRKKAGMTLGDVAREFGVSVTNVSAAERHLSSRLKDMVHPAPSEAQIVVYISTDRAVHPYGRCTCAGEGTCEWHQGRCEECCGSGVQNFGVDLVCEACDGSGRKDAEADWERAEAERERLEQQLRTRRDFRPYGEDPGVLHK